MPNLQRIDDVVAAIATRDERMGGLRQEFEERDGQVFISAAALGQFLGYSDQSRFRSCVNRAKITATQTGKTIESHFLSPELFDRHQDDLWLSPWAALASIMEADPKKPLVAQAKSYFAALASEEIAADEARLRQRHMFKENFKQMHSSAEQSGVTSSKDHAIFDDAGYRGMYRRSAKEVKQLKGVPDKLTLADCAGPTELAASSLRMAMTKDALDHGEAHSKSQANQVHHSKGSIVRKAVKQGTGMYPEILPLENKTLDQLSREKKKELGA